MAAHRVRGKRVYTRVNKLRYDVSIAGSSGEEYASHERVPCGTSVVLRVSESQVEDRETSRDRLGKETQERDWLSKRDAS